MVMHEDEEPRTAAIPHPELRPGPSALESYAALAIPRILDSYVMRVEASRDPIGQWTNLLVRLCTVLVTLPLLILTPPVTFLGGFLSGVPGVGRVFTGFLDAIWFAFLALLITTSWVWARVPILRPLLLPIGIVLATLGYAFVSLTPAATERAALAVPTKFVVKKEAKLVICQCWPFSSQAVWAYEAFRAKEGTGV